MLPTLDQLKYFIEVSDTLNISRASERLAISQPSLSVSLKKLEENIGVPLLLRQKNGIQLTRAGKEFAVLSRSMLENWSNIKNATIHSSHELMGTYRIGSHSALGAFTHPLYINEILEENPKLNLKLDHSLSRNITEGVISFHYDFGIVVNPVQHPDLVIRHLANSNVKLWRKNSRLKHLDLSSGKGILIADTSLSQSKILINKLKKVKLEPERIIEVDDLEVITRLTTNGIGIGIIPETVIHQSSRMKIKEYGQKAPIIKDQICLIYRHDTMTIKSSRQLARRIESLISQKLA